MARMWASEWEQQWRSVDSLSKLEPSQTLRSLSTRAGLHPSPPHQTLTPIRCLVFASPPHPHTTWGKTLTGIFSLLPFIFHQLWPPPFSSQTWEYNHLNKAARRTSCPPSLYNSMPPPTPPLAAVKVSIHGTMNIWKLQYKMKNVIQNNWVE